MKVKILKCVDCADLQYYRGHYSDAYQYTVRVYDGIARGTYTFDVTKEEVRSGVASAVIQKELDELFWRLTKKQAENEKAQSIVGRVFHWYGGVDAS